MLILIALSVLFALSAVRYPKPLAAFSLLLLIFAKPLEQWTDGLFTYLDEAIPVLCLIIFSSQRLLLGSRLRWFPGLGWFIAFALVGMTSSVVAAVPLSVFLPGAFLLLKGLVFGIAVGQLDWTDEDIRKVTHWAAWAFAILIALGLINLIVPEAWAQVFANSATVDYQLGLPSLVGPFIHPGDFGIIMATGTLAVLAYRHSIRRSKMSLLLVIGGTALSFMALRRKTWAGLAAAAVWLKIATAKQSLRRAIRANPLIAALGLACVLAVGLGLWLSGIVEQTFTQYFINWESSPRTRLTLGAFQVASEHFPLGAGFGRYGSYLAEIEYSPEYVKLGFESIWGLSTLTGNGLFLTDTQWPAILGEAGWLGGLAYVLGLWRIGRSFRLPSKSVARRGWSVFLSLVGMAWMIEVLIESVASPVLMASPAFGLIFFIAGVKRGHVAATTTSKTQAGQTA